eukprot:g2737.t1
MTSVSVRLEGHGNHLVTLNVVPASEVGRKSKVNSHNKDSGFSGIKFERSSTNNQESHEKANREEKTRSTKKKIKKKRRRVRKKKVPVKKKDFFKINRESCVLGSLARFHNGERSVAEYRTLLEERDRKMEEEAKQNARERRRAWQETKKKIAENEARLQREREQRLREHEEELAQQELERIENLKRMKAHADKLRRHKDEMLEKAREEARLRAERARAGEDVTKEIPWGKLTPAQKKDVLLKRFAAKEAHMKTVKANKDRIMRELILKKEREARLREKRKADAELEREKRRLELVKKAKANEEKILKIATERHAAEIERKNKRRDDLIERHKVIAARKYAPGPGPGQYKLPDIADTISGGSWSTANPKSDVDVRIYEASQMPGPGHYTLPDQATQVRGGTWGKQNPKSDLEMMLLEKAQMPAPCEYTLPDVSTLIKGGTWGKHSGKSEVEKLQMEASKIPGPGAYGMFSEFDRFAHPMEKEKFNPMNKPGARRKLRGKEAELQLQAFLKRQMTVEGGVSQYDDNGKLLDWETRRANAKAAKEFQRKKMMKHFAEKEVLLREKREKKARHFAEAQALKQKKLAIAAKQRERNAEKLAEGRRQLRLKMQRNQAKVMLIKEQKWHEEQERQNIRRLELIKTHKRKKAKEDAKIPTPGPSAYKLPDQATQVTGGTWGKFVSKSELDRIILRANDTPAPNQYKLPDQATQVTGGTWGKFSGKSETELLIEAAKETPGPGAYTLPDQTTQVTGGKFGKFSGKSQLDMQILEAKETPAPNEYGVLSIFDVPGSPYLIEKFKRSVHPSVAQHMEALKSQKKKKKKKFH